MNGQDKILRIIYKFDIRENWIASKLHMSPQRLNYQLHGAKDISYDLYTEIMEIFKDAGILYDSPDECAELVQKALYLSDVINSQLSEIAKEVREDVADNILTEQERERLRKLIANARRKFGEQLAQIEELIR